MKPDMQTIPTDSSRTWIDCHLRAFAYFQGCPKTILLECGRKYVARLNGQNREPIGSLYYFNPILQEVLSEELSKDYCRFNRMQVTTRKAMAKIHKRKSRIRLRELCATKSTKRKERRDDVEYLTGVFVVKNGWGNNLENWQILRFPKETEYGKLNRQSHTTTS
jgi:hypothetical protein